MELSQSAPISFLIRTEVASSYLSDLLVFIYQEYVLPYYTHFTNVGRWVADGKEVLTFTLNDAHGAWYINAEISATNPVEVKLTPYGNLPPKILSRLREDLIISVQIFEEKIRRTTLYFAWVPEKKVVPEKIIEETRRKIIRQIFMGNIITLLIISMILSIVAFVIITVVFNLPLIYFLFIMVLSQFIMILFSDKIIGSMGDWSITASNPYVQILQYHIPPEQFGVFREKNTRDKLLQVKRAIQNKTLALGGLDAQSAQEVFNEYGINVRPENIVIKTVNVYDIVKDVAARFRMPIPKIKLSNVIIPNAAATGPSPRFGLVLITTGLLVQLDDDEIQAVIGHEISHVKKRDPMALFAITTAEYILRIYIWTSMYFFGWFIYFFYFYFLLVFEAIYFIAKFFEARADLDSAIILGQPALLASALRKIGYRRIQLERLHSNRIESWINGNPHPPTSFRVDRLENLEEPQKIKHPFIKSIKDCVNGLLHELKHT
jgi:heat shock protein HtpX